MSLDWDCEACANPLPADKEEAGIRTALIWATMGLSLGSIKEDNVDEWVFRIFHQQRLGLDFLYLDKEVTPQEVEGWVRRWIGMFTNVSTKPRKKWLKEMCEILEKRTIEQLQYYKQGKAEAL